MHAEDIPTYELRPYEHNNRVHSDQQIRRIAKSIEEFGFNQPIVVDENMTVLVGHGRLYAAELLDLDRVPVVKLSGLTDEQKRAYRILDNKLQNDSSWDFESLKIELEHLNLQGADLSDWGLDELQLLVTKPDGESVEDPIGEWQDGMPEFTRDKAGPVRSLIEHFQTAEDVSDFIKLTKLPIGEKTKYVYFPEQIIEKISDKRVVSEV